MNWTPQQEDAITAQGRSIIVSAAAGSGKTAVLVERLLRILTEQRVSADSIVVVTFTRDAAAQMKQRLTAMLTKELDKLADSDDMDTYDWLLEQRAALSNANISTIHSFCFSLIREYAEICNVSPDFDMVEDTALYRKRAMQTVLERWSQREEMELLFSNFCTRDDSELEKVIFSIAEYLESLPFHREWIRKAIRYSTDGSELLRCIRKDLLAGIEDVIQLAAITKQAATAAAPPLAPAENPFYRKVEEEIAAFREQIASLQQLSDEELLVEPTGTVVSFETVVTKGLSKSIDKEAKKLFTKCRNQYKDTYKKLVAAYLEPLRYFAEDLETQEKMIPLLLTMTEEYLDALSEEKRRQNVLSFSDAEELALRLLGYVDENGNIHRTELAETLSGQISLIMVDEYQDSNNKQDCLFKLLSRDAVISEDGLHYGSNAFLVGDVKQSIYAFRLANPENFRNAIAESVPLAECKDGDMARIYLNQNFRSAPGVLDFVNALFGALMTERCGEVLYDENEQLNFGAAHFADAGHIRTKLLFPQPEAELPEEQDAQAECIADTIDSILRSGQTVPDKKLGRRPCAPGDFCVLLRNKGILMTRMTEALKRRGIPFVSDGSTNLLDFPEVRLVCNLLHIVDNPMADTPMAAVLCSPVCGFSAEDLALLKAYGKANRIWLQLREVAKAETLPDEVTPLQKRTIVFLEMLDKLRREQVVLEELVQQIYDVTDLFSLQGLYEDAELRRLHLDAFLQAAQQYRTHADLSAQSGLSGWLRYIDRLTESGGKLAGLSPSGGNGCVSVKTIHKSKGLEFPFVFLAHPEIQFNTSSDSKQLILTSANGLVGMYLHDSERFLKTRTVACQYLLGGLRKRQKSEEMRLLYVALTRAEQQLFVVMDSKLKKDAPVEMLRQYPDMAPFLAAGANSMQDWLLYYLLSCTESEHLVKAVEAGESSRSALAEYCVWTKHTASPKPGPELAETHSLPDGRAFAAMEEQLKFSYKSPHTELASKYSVTQLAHPEKTMELAKTPEFTLEGSSGRKKKLQGAARGTAVHKILQYMNMSAASEDPGAELERLHAQGVLTDAEARAVTAEQLAAFFGSELYGRIAASETVFREKQLFVRIGELKLPENAALAAQYAGTDGVLIGTMDLLFREEDGWVLVDYKTDYAREGETLLKEYSLQLGLYQKAAELLLGEPVKEAYLYSFTLGKALKVGLDEIIF